jgi:murein L,D-transpeptidase YcbB/YkuD
MKYAAHLALGRVDPRRLDANWVGQKQEVDLPSLLEAALSKGRVSSTLEGLLPRHPQYGLLKGALQRYRSIAGRGGWPTTLSVKGRPRKGERGPEVALLRTRLQASADRRDTTFLARLTGLVRSPDFFDETLARDLARFKERHGLEPDELLDQRTVAALNVPVQQRVRQIELNLERWRWLPQELGRRYIMVNIPTYTLEGFENGRRTLEMRVAAGTREHPTPIFSERMTQVVFSPYWNIPPRIAREEWIPEVVRDPDYLRQNNLEILKGDRVVDPLRVNWTDKDLRLRQRPGATNVLGLVTFAFPNRFNVYIHDTPYESEFHRASRDLSHGCVRVDKPEELAQWVLSGQNEWNRKAIDAAMHSGTQQRVEIEQPIPVYLIYQTAWVREDGAVWFADDPYGHDAAQLALLDKVSR